MPLIRPFLKNVLIIVKFVYVSYTYTLKVDGYLQFGINKASLLIKCE